MATDQTRRRAGVKLTEPARPDFRWSAIGLRAVTDLTAEAPLLAARRCGCIVTHRGRLQAIYGRWWPHQGTLMQMVWDINFRTVAHDRCELYYHRPLTSPDFLTLSYVHSGPQTSVGTLYSAGLVLDEIAKLHNVKAIVSNVTNSRISNRSLRRWGWEPHCPNLAGRHFIKRFYGHYPDISPVWRARLVAD